MGRFFSDKVETAIRYIYYDLGTQRGQEGFRLLQEACREGDADAYCLLARCLYGQEYTWTPTLTACWRAVCTGRNTPGWGMIFR